MREEACQRRLQSEEDELAEQLKLEQHVEECLNQGQVWKECASNCTRTCEDLDPVCTVECVPRCQCPSDQPIWENGECIREEACQRRLQDDEDELTEELVHEQHVEACADNGQIWKECGSNCTRTC